MRGHWWTAVNSGPIESLQCVCVVVSTVSDSSLFNSSPWPCTATAARSSLVASGTVSYLQNCCHRLEASVVVPDCGLHQLAAFSYGWDDSRSVTSAGWQVHCDPTWHVSSHISVARLGCIILVNCYTVFILLCFTLAELDQSLLWTMLCI